MEQKVMRWPPALWADLEATVPERKRSAFIRRAVEKALALEKRRQAKAVEQNESVRQNAARRGATRRAARPSEE
jgi:hypothetical protein